MKSSFRTGADQRLVTDLYWPSSIPRGETSNPAKPAAIPRAMLLCIHGLGDHAGSFESFATAAVKRNLAVAALDMRGHGRSPGRRGHAESYDVLLDDVSALRESLTQDWPEVPQFLIGHSAGGNIALNYLLRRGEFGDARGRQFKTGRHAASNASGTNSTHHTRRSDNMLGDLIGLVLLSPMLLPPQPVTRTQILAAWLTGHLVPWFRVQKRPSVRKLTANPEQQHRIREDSQRHGRLSIYLATQLLSQGRWAIDHARSVDLQTLLLFGESDELIDRDAVRHAALRIGDLATTVTWPGGLHDLLHDIDSDRVSRQVLDWIDDQLRPTEIKSDS